MVKLLDDVKKVGVFWSSGLESTLLLLMCIDKYGKDNVYAFTQKTPVDDVFANGVKHYHYYAQQLADELDFANHIIIETPSNSVYVNRLREESYYNVVSMMPDLDVLYLGINEVQFGRLADPEHKKEVLNKISEMKLMATPFLNITKAQVVDLYYQLGYEKWITFTRSCAKNIPVHCGTCTNCSERKLAFSVSGRTDPTVYRP